MCKMGYNWINPPEALATKVWPRYGRHGGSTKSKDRKKRQGKREFGKKLKTPLPETSGEFFTRAQGSDGKKGGPGSNREEPAIVRGT